MSGEISLTIAEEEEIFLVTSTEVGVITIEISDVAVVDPEVAIARDEAVAAAAVATTKAQEAVDAVTGLDTVIENAVNAAIEAERPNAIINALIFG